MAKAILFNGIVSKNALLLSTLLVSATGVLSGCSSTTNPVNQLEATPVVTDQIVENKTTEEPPKKYGPGIETCDLVDINGETIQGVKDRSMVSATSGECISSFKFHVRRNI